ncbi:MAG: LON peptidase substrate-binding domain-containing protein, partial [Candidatus Aminicenantes bacterium]
MAKKEDDFDEKYENVVEDDGQKLNIPKEMPVLMLRDIVVFPYMVVPLFVGREKSKEAIDQALSSHRMILLLTQKDMEIEDPKREDVFEIGTVALVMRMLKLPDGRVRILAQGIVRAKIQTLDEEKDYYSARIQVLHEP